MDDPQFMHPSDIATKPRQSRFAAKYNFPFDQVPLNMSFPVGKDQVKNINVLRTLANRAGIKLNRKFRIIEHESAFEVYYSGVRDVSLI